MCHDVTLLKVMAALDAKIVGHHETKHALLLALVAREVRGWCRV
jgi:hypothetical protein